MRKLLLSLSVVALSLLMLASVVSAAGGSGTASDMVQVSGTDAVSGGEASWVTPWLNDMVDRWGLAYGWKPSQTTNVYLYTAGSSMANDLATFRGSALSPTDFGNVTTSVGGITTPDTRPGGPGGFAVLVNLNSTQFGGGVGVAPFYRTEVKGAIAKELAGLMVSDLTGSGGPTWLRVGLVNYLTENEVPGLQNATQRYMTLASVMQSGVAPGVMALQNDWNGVTAMSPQMLDAATAISTATVRILVPQIGVMGVVNLIKSASTGGDFNSLLMAATGMSLSQIDLAYKAPVMAMMAALSAATSGG